jgi:hypothetical protein
MTNFFMIRGSLKTLKVVCWVTSIISVAAFFLLALYTPEVALFDSTSQRDQEIQRIKAEQDISRLQSIAIMNVSVGYGTGATATLLCRVALVTELVVITASIVNLVQIRKLARVSKRPVAESGS